MKILVVEDDKTVGEYVRRGLDEAGYHAELVGDGDQGLRLATGGHFDLLVLDLRLPKLSGIEVSAGGRSAISDKDGRFALDAERTHARAAAAAALEDEPRGEVGG